MNKRRLLKLADLLEADAKNKKGIKFNLCIVGETTSEADEAPLDCGTTACAMGLAAISGAFKRQGLSYKIRGPFIDTTINGRRRDFDRAAQLVFDISNEEAYFLFGPLSYPSDKLYGAVGERYVAQRIRSFVDGDEAHSMVRG